MAFSRFFGRGRENSPAPEPQAQPEEEPEQAESSDEGDVDPEAAAHRSWRERAEAALPSGASTGSKRASALWGDDAPDDLPTHFANARGCRVVDADGNSYLDCTMAL